MDFLCHCFSEQIHRLKGWANAPQPPLNLVLYPTDRCNLGCVFCRNANKSSTECAADYDEMSDSEWMKIVSDGLEMGVLVWRIVGGGEPMVRRELVLSMVEMIGAHPSRTLCELHSHGALFTEDAIRRLIDAHVDIITVSLNGATAAQHDKLTSMPGSFDRVVKALKQFRDLKRENKTDTPIIRIHGVVCRENAHDIESILPLASELGVQVLEFQEVIDMGIPSGVFDSIRLQQEDFASLHKRSENLMKLAHEVGVYLVADEAIIPASPVPGHEMPAVEPLCSSSPAFSLAKGRQSQFPQCLEPWHTLAVNAKGYVYPCCVAGDKPGAIPSSPTLREVSLAEAWDSEHMHEVRGAVYAGNRPSMCAKCPIQDYQLINRMVGYLDNQVGEEWQPVRQCITRGGV